MVENNTLHGPLASTCMGTYTRVQLHTYIHVLRGMQKKELFWNLFTQQKTSGIHLLKPLSHSFLISSTAIFWWSYSLRVFYKKSSKGLLSLAHGRNENADNSAPSPVLSSFSCMAQPLWARSSAEPSQQASLCPGKLREAVLKMHLVFVEGIPPWDWSWLCLA